jgi:hypothetical protein
MTSSGHAAEQLAKLRFAHAKISFTSKGMHAHSHQNLNRPVTPMVRGRMAVAEYSESVTLA